MGRSDGCITLCEIKHAGVTAWQLAGLEQPSAVLHEARADAYRRHRLDTWLKQQIEVSYPFPMETREISRTIDNPSEDGSPDSGRLRGTVT